jgi:hypothetical protein
MGVRPGACFGVDLESKRTAVRIVDHMSELIVTSSGPKVVAIGIPIGLPTMGSRACDI